MNFERSNYTLIKRLTFAGSIRRKKMIRIIKNQIKKKDFIDLDGSRILDAQTREEQFS